MEENFVVNGVEFGLFDKITNNTIVEKDTYFMYKNKKYVLHKHGYSTIPDDFYYSISRSFNSMNVDKITKRYISLYSFDMMGNKTTYKMAIEEMMFDANK